ncbi:hypothetical protein [Desulfovibrio inopinatus]|uniref:NrdR family transcriptional regulator n=1 Tax=Desulfovibrio inopinatus TaxID=102109 RepID=UPI003CCBFBC9
MNCPKCGAKNPPVVTSRTFPKTSNLRWRVCRDCGAQITTHEIIASCTSVPESCPDVTHIPHLDSAALSE